MDSILIYALCFMCMKEELPSRINCAALKSLKVFGPALRFLECISRYYIFVSLICQPSLLVFDDARM